MELGPDHPTRPGLVEIITIVSDDTITDARINIGHLHRGAEKLFEVRDYLQIPALASRHDWQAPFIGELGACLVTERAIGIVPPARATWLRTALVEFSRMMSHLAFLTWLPFRAREEAIAAQMRTVINDGHQLWQEFSGNRVHPMISRPGGLTIEPSAQWWADLQRWMDTVVTLTPDLAAILSSPLRQATTGIATLSAEMIDTHGLSGPVARASGVPDPLPPDHLAHHDLDLPPRPDLPTTGDARARLAHLIAEVDCSADLVNQVIATLPEIDGPVNVRLPSVVKAPRGHTWSSLAAPWGQAGYLLVSHGERTPWRLALRTPTFANVQALETVLPGTPLASVDAAIASLGWTLGDLDK